MSTATTPEDITTFLLGLFRTTLQVEVSTDENLFANGIVDSVGIMRIVAGIEDHYQTKIPPADLLPANFRTPQRLAQYLSGHLHKS